MKTEYDEDAAFLSPITGRIKTPFFLIKNLLKNDTGNVRLCLSEKEDMYMEEKYGFEQK